MLWIKGPARAQKQPAKIEKKKIMKKQIVEFAYAKYVVIFNRAYIYSTERAFSNFFFILYAIIN